MLKTILIYCLLAFSTAQAATWYLGEGQNNKFNSLWDSLSTDDVIQVMSSYVDSSLTSNAVKSDPQPDSIKVYLNGFDIEFVSTDADGYVLLFGSGAYIYNLQIIGPGSITVPGGFLYFAPRDGTDLTITDVDFVNTGAAEKEFVYSTTRAISITLDGCSFTWGSSVFDSEQALYLGNTTLTDIDDCTFSGGPAYCINFPSLNAASAADIRGCTFSGFDEGGIIASLGGSIEVNDCDFTAQTAGSVRKGISFNPATGSTHNAVFDSLDFTNASLFCATGTGDVAHGDSVTVSNCTFTGMGNTYPLYMRARRSLITGCTFNSLIGNATDAHRMIMLGADGGSDVADTTSAFLIRVIDNTLTPTFTATYNGGTVYLIEAKCDSAFIEKNTLGFSSAINSDSTTAALINLRGASNATIQNNDLTRRTGVSAFRYSEQASGELNDDHEIYSNRIFGTGGYLFNAVDWYGTLYDQDSLFTSFNYNYIEGSTTIYGIDLAEGTATGESWYGSNNFSSDTGWQYKYGGKPSTTYSTAQGFTEPGAIPTSAEPRISRTLAGFETPVKAALVCRELGLTGIEMDWVTTRNYTPDALNLEVWLNGTHQTGDGTAGSGTWEAEMLDTLKIGEIK